MLFAAFYILLAAVLLGMGASLFHLGVLSRRSWMVAALHGVVALAGLMVLILGLGGPAHGFANGVQSFGVFAAVFAAVALVLGAVFLFLPAARRSWLIGAHATLGIAGVVFLSGYLLLG